MHAVGTQQTLVPSLESSPKWEWIHVICSFLQFSCYTGHWVKSSAVLKISNYASEQ